ncbi:Conserved_hypothetical protein [Hexamita inflata]|uniref:Uncharacterized protein n=1 Tax=Hexamita inflata TaxID=28002 RepID=A0AA86QMJ4_9EUKA|nr:Conserved hypothetical protein [Hexamita inflata]
MMIPKLDLSQIKQEVKQTNQKSSRDSSRSYEHAEKITLTDINCSMKFKISITIAYLLATTDSFHVEYSDNDYVIKSRSFSGEMLERVSQLIRIQPTVLLQTIDNIKIDVFMMNEISQCAFGILNYVDKHYNTSSIWDVPNVYEMFEIRNLRDIENECVIIQKATPRGKLF